MSKAKPMTPEAARLANAQKAADDAKRAEIAARDAADAARAKYYSALAELSDARKEFDLASYPAAIVRSSYHGRVIEESVVVVKRNKRITTRVPGREGTNRQWKLQDGEWVPYERWRNRDVLVLDCQ